MTAPMSVPMVRPPGVPRLMGEEMLEHLRQATMGEYEIYGELGRGGMATVYLAQDLALGRQVAIKVMSPALIHGEGMVERFKREARTAAGLSHPNIIPVYAVRETDRLLFFVMKFVKGRALDSVIKELGPLPIPMIQTILGQVGSAFGYAHRRGIIHRDIKPANIMIDDEGWAVVTDFGIAKVSESQGLTMTGMTVGTPTYMSPEQCLAQEVTGASDQYSLGVVAYEMITGRAPFVGNSMMAIMYGHFNDPPPPLEGLRPDCPPVLRDAVLRMLEKDPLRRWGSIEDAVAPIGVTTLAHDDPTRSQLIELAKSGPAFQAFIAAQASIPQSPVPKTRARVATPSSSAPTTRLPAGRPTNRPVVAGEKKSKRGLLVGGAFAALAAAALIYLAPWKKPAEAPSVTLPESADVTPTPVVESPATEMPPVTTDPAATSTPAPASTPAPEKPTKPVIDPSNRAQAKRDAADYQRMKTQADEARDHAIAFGATSTDLAGGDGLRSQGETFAKRGKFGDALKPISDATVVYMAAARTAQSRAETQARINTPPATAPLVVETKPATPPAPAPPAESVTPKSTEPPGSVAAKPSAPPDERPAVEQVVTAYAAALSAGDMGELLRTYPGMPDDVQSSLRDYFRAGNSLDTSKWHIGDVVISGNSATVKIGGTMTARDHRGKVSSQTPPRSARLERGASGWRIVGLN
ncbi:MAG TPA: protein kinase [Gemmatimonadales bacterium]|nr:protein kinase [Gemmatimonadales bacterium]